MPYGTRLGFAGDRLRSITDRHGHRLAELRWHGDAATLTVAVAPATGTADAVEIDGALREDALFGQAHAIARVVDGVRASIARISPMAWAPPRALPAIDRPAALPRSTGGLILDAIAIAARRAGVAALRYAGPYPTRALWQSLQGAFRCAGDEDGFAAGAPLDFAPAPFERHWVAPRIAVELREGLERALIDGHTYGADGAHRLVDGHAELWIGDAAIARIASFAADGALVDGPHPPQPITSRALGQRFPPALCSALAALCADTAAPALAAAIAAELTERALVWADTGVALVQVRDDGALAINALLWERLAPHGLARVARALAEALGQTVRALAQARLAAAW